jgi:hypothetical protein
VNSHVLQIVIFRDGNPVGSEVFLPGEYTVGSHYGCELVLPDPKVAPTQARLSFRGGRIRLSDLGRVPAGTQVNGRPLGNGEVSSRDDVAVGPFLLKFRVMGSQPGANGEEGAGLALPTQAAGAPHRPPIPRQPPPVPRDASPVAAAPADLFKPSPQAPPGERGSEAAAARPAAVPAPMPRPSPREAPRTAAVRDPLPPLAASPSEPSAPPGDLRAMPSLRVRVFWGHAMVGIHGFPFGRKVVAAAREEADVPIYGLALPAKRFSFASVRKGRWTVRVPPGLTAYRFEKSGWRPVNDASDGNSEDSAIAMDPGEVVQMGDARHSIEVRVDRVPAVPRKSIREQVDRQFGIPLSIFSTLGLAAMIAMPYFKQEQADFVPRHIAPVRALLKPPEKKKPEENKDEKKEKEKEKKEKKEEKAPPDPAKKAAVKTKAIKAVEKTAVAVKAVESLLKATTKLTGGPKGYGDKGMGFKVSPLIGKPPIVQAGLGFGAGMGGFGAETKGIGSMRGMGGGGGIGSFATGSVGKGKVAGAVISANVRKAEVRGQLDRELIAKVINEHMGEIRGCYERALLKEAGLAGKLVLEWTIETNGIVSEVRVKTATLRGPDVPNCIIGGLKGWSFPKPKGGNVVVSYPFLFNSVGF